LQAGLAIQNAKLYHTGLQGERMAAIGETTAALLSLHQNILQALRGRKPDVVEIGIRAKNMVQVTKGWRVAERNLQKIYNLTMNLLAYSRPREPKFEMVNPSPDNECVELLAQSANEKRVMVWLTSIRDHPVRPAGSRRMHQVLMNLLGNALDAVEAQRGLIRVVGHYDGDKQGCHHRGDRQRRRHTHDDDEALVRTIPFHEGQPRHGPGSGRAKKIVDEHEGNIMVKSAPAKAPASLSSARLPCQRRRPVTTHGPAAEHANCRMDAGATRSKDS